MISRERLPLWIGSGSAANIKAPRSSAAMLPALRNRVRTYAVLKNSSLNSYVEPGWRCDDAATADVMMFPVP
jgi:hypothetical protein